MILNGERAPLAIEGVHAGKAGWQQPSPTDRARGASRIAAIRPDTGKPAAGQFAEGQGRRWQVMFAERSTVPGIWRLGLLETE